MQELRADRLSGHQVILAPARARRPEAFRVAAAPAPAADAQCPFCAGHEDQTPPEVARTGGGAPDTPGWRVRTVPNKYPMVGDGVRGAHEVVILSPAHNADLARAGVENSIEAFAMLRDRARFHLERGLVYPQAFVNQGKAAGASLEHPHAQLVVLDMVPPAVTDRVERFAHSGRDVVADDARAGVPVATGDVDVWCPAAAISPFFTRVALRDAAARFDYADDAETAAVATAVHDVVARLHRVLGEVPYNVVVQTAPATITTAFHWWVDLVPRLTTVAGFELGTGIYVNIVTPGDAAAALRES